MDFYRNFFPLPPLADPGAPGHRFPQRLAGTGATESSTSRKLRVGKIHVLVVGASAVRVRFSAVAGTATAVDATRDVVYGPYSQIPFVPEENEFGQGSTVVYAEAADGIAAYECFVMQLQS